VDAGEFLKAGSFCERPLLLVMLLTLRTEAGPSTELSSGRIASDAASQDTGRWLLQPKNLSERWVGEPWVGEAKIRVIQNVEELQTDPQLATLPVGNFRVFHNHEIGVNTTGSPSYGPCFIPVGTVGPDGRPADIARQRGIGVHVGRRAPQSPTRGCLRVSDATVDWLCRYAQFDPIRTITIR